MSNGSWAPTTPEATARRAGGRRRYNRERQDAAAVRRILLIDLVKEFGLEYGAQAAMAERLGVHRSTITRDLQVLMDGRRTPCGTCGTRLTPEQWKNADRWEKAQWANA